MVSRAGAEEALLEVLRGIPDPEVPVLDIVELGIVRKVELRPTERWRWTVTPTYSGCPAMQVIEQEIVAALRANGYDRVELRTVYSPAWTTDWLSDAAKAKLRAYGIAPPDHAVVEQALVPLDVGGASRGLSLLRLLEHRTRRASSGRPPARRSTSATDCHQPFEEFKAI